MDPIAGKGDSEGSRGGVLSQLVPDPRKLEIGAALFGVTEAWPRDPLDPLGLLVLNQKQHKRTNAFRLQGRESTAAPSSPSVCAPVNRASSASATSANLRPEVRRSSLYKNLLRFLASQLTNTNASHYNKHQSLRARFQTRSPAWDEACLLHV